MRIRETLKNIPPYVPGKLVPGAIKLASNENPLGPSPLAMQRLAEISGQVHLYPDNGCLLLREALAQKHGLEPENIVAGNGSDEIMCLAAAAYVNPGDIVVTAETTFSNYAFAAQLFGGRMRRAPLRDGVFDLDALARLVDGKTRLVFLCNPNNPTGTYFPHTALADFLAKIPPEVLVVCDEAYADYAEAQDFPSSLSFLSAFPNLLIMRTFSKLYGLAGLRVGYGICSPEVASHLRTAKVSFSVNLPGLAAAQAALEDTEFVKKSLAVNREGKKELSAEFERLGLSYYPTQANFFCVNVKRSCHEVFQKILEGGVTIRPLASFGLEESIRVTIGSQEQNRKFIAALEKALAE